MSWYVAYGMNFRSTCDSFVSMPSANPYAFLTFLPVPFQISYHSKLQNEYLSPEKDQQKSSDISRHSKWQCVRMAFETCTFCARIVKPETKWIRNGRLNRLRIERNDVSVNTSRIETIAKHVSGWLIWHQNRTVAEWVSSIVAFSTSIEYYESSKIITGKRIIWTSNKFTTAEKAFVHNKWGLTLASHGTRKEVEGKLYMNDIVTVRHMKLEINQSPHQSLDASENRSVR